MTEPEADRPPRRSGRRRSVPGYVGVLVLLALVTGGYAFFFSPHGRAQDGDTSLAVRQGRQLYLQDCSTCHGLQAQGNGPSDKLAPSLIGVGAAAVDFQVSTGRMPLARQGAQAPRKRPRLNQQQIDQLAAYIASLAPGPARPSDTELDTSDADLQQGGALFRVNCASCHNFAGKGGALTYGQYAPTLQKATPRQIYEAMLTGPEAMPVFGDRSITPDEKRDIIKFITTTRAQPDPGGHGIGRLGPIPEGVVAWVVGIGSLVLVTLWIGART